MFIGSYQNQLDAKYRMIIPSKYRKELCPEGLAQKCIITKESVVDGERPRLIFAQPSELPEEKALPEPKKARANTKPSA